MIDKKRAQKSRAAVAGIRRGLGSNSAALMVQGVTTRTLGDELTRRALLWVWRWGWAAPSTIDYLTLDGQRRGKAARLEARGLLRALKPGTFAPDAPRKVLVLTDAGIEELTRLHENVDIRLAGTKIRWNQLRHDYIVQNIVAESVIQRSSEYISGPELAIQQKDLPKVPDAVIEGEIIELELSAKKEYELHLAARGLYELCDPMMTGFYKIKIISTQNGILNGYGQLLRAGAKIKRIKKLGNRTYREVGFYDPIPDFVNLKLFKLKSTTPTFAKNPLEGAMYDMKQYTCP